jgi:hypothetical protein
MKNKVWQRGKKRVNVAVEQRFEVMNKSGNSEIECAMADKSMDLLNPNVVERAQDDKNIGVDSSNHLESGHDDRSLDILNPNNSFEEMENRIVENAWTVRI